MKTRFNRDAWFAFAIGTLIVNACGYADLTFNQTEREPLDITVVESLRTTTNHTTETPIQITDGKPNTVSVTARSSNTELLSIDRLAITGQGPERRLQFTPSAGENGEVVVTLTATNNVGAVETADIKVTVDAPFETLQTAGAINASSADGFGMSVAIDGNRAIIGAYTESVDGQADVGSAYIFEHDGNSWRQTAKLNATDAGASDYFGRSVSISGSFAIVGAIREDPNGTTDAGSAYIYETDGEAWTQTAKLVASDLQANATFGFAVDLSGDYAIVGAQRQDLGAESEAGSAYVFKRINGTWTQTAKITAEDAQDSDFFGASVAFSGDEVVIGATREDGNGTNRGSAYVFRRDGEQWTQTAKLIPDEPQDGAFFGGSVARSGDTIVVGADSHNTDAGSFAGRAYIFNRNGDSWTQTAVLEAEDGQANDLFGISVAIDGDYALIGAFGADQGGNAVAGSAYVFKRDGAAWSQLKKLVAEDPPNTDAFGTSVAIAGDSLVVGAPHLGQNNTTIPGRAALFTR